MGVVGEEEGLAVRPGLCGSCRHANLNQTRRGPTYLRCTRSAWDPRLVRYPALPVLSCVGFEALTAEDGGAEVSGSEVSWSGPTPE